LNWNQVGVADEYCFDAQSHDGKNNLYSVNVITGVVLVNGKPINSLPSAITNRAIYKRSFGDRNFEISMTSVGVAETLRPISQYFYSFHEDVDTKHLTIIEKHEVARSEEDAENSLELLDSVTSHHWKSNLPKLLREECSHWICRKKNVIVFRDKYFSNKNVYFLLKFDFQDNANVPAVKCISIPNHLQSKHWIELCSCFDTNDQLRLIMNNSKVSQVLSKFEQVEYIHTFLIESTGNILFSLPRFGLSFELNKNDSVVYSLDYTNFFLDKFEQQLHFVCIIVMVFIVIGIVLIVIFYCCYCYRHCC
jgi:hypothetical protein